MEGQGRGAKSAGSWDPRCQKVFEESGSGRKFWTISTHFSASEQVGSIFTTKQIVINLRSNESLTQKLIYTTANTQTRRTKGSCKNKRTAFWQKVFDLKPQDARNAFDFLHHWSQLGLRTS